MADIGRQTHLIMGMPVSLEIVDSATQKEYDEIFDYFTSVDERFSTYKETSEISKINQGELLIKDASRDMQEVFRLAEETRQETGGYFNIERPDGTIDPSGLVKGWAIYHAAELLAAKGFRNFYVDAGGDIEARGNNREGIHWSVGIKNPFNEKEYVKVVYLSGQGIATSGNYIRGDHIYDPHTAEKISADIVSLTVIAQNVYEADRFATAAFAMGKKGIEFIEQRSDLAGYMIDIHGMATQTSNFSLYIQHV